MPLEAPKLDTRTFEDLVREARLRIPRYTPEWTDWNASDPGITLLELFAWFTEIQLYQMNRIPERNYVKFLQLMGLELEPAQPAIAHLTFYPDPKARAEPVGAGTEIEAQPPEGDLPLVFETEVGLDLVPVPLSDVQVFDGDTFTVITAANEADDATFRPLGWVPRVGSALYLGFREDDAQRTQRRFPAQMRFRVDLPPAEKEVATAVTVLGQETPPPGPAVDLRWEYKPTESSPWRLLNVFHDETASWTREGYLLLEGPPEIHLAELRDGSRITEPRYWLRCRLTRGGYEAGGEPEVHRIRPNVVPARNLQTVREEVVGESLGLPHQSFTLERRPVAPGSLELWTEGEGVEPTLWRPVEDFLASGGDDPDYVLHAGTGRLELGDGRHGRIPVAGALIVARVYRWGGGAAGNVGAGQVNAPSSYLPGVDRVTNERPAVGGRDEQSVEELKAEAPRRLRHRHRAVTAEDFAALAEQAGGVLKATALPLAHPDFPGVEVPGAVTVVIVPDAPQVPPRPSTELLLETGRYLDRFRLLTTELHLKAPRYLEVRILVEVAAEPYAAFGAVAEAVREKVDQFLDPRRQEFGQDVFPTRFFEVVLGAEGAREVKSLRVEVDGQGLEKLDTQIIVPEDGLVYGGEHEIHVVPFEDF